MSDEEELDASGALAVDEDQDELLEEMTMDERKGRLKQARWNVFMYLGIAAILFFFALFPMPFSADYDGFTSSAEKDIGLVWGLPLDGEDMFDVPMKIEVTASKPPSEANIHLGVFVLEEKNCGSNLGDFTTIAKNGGSHEYQYQETTESVLPDGIYEFEFGVDPGHYCVIVEYVDATGEKVGQPSDGMSVSGKIYPNQFFFGVAGFLCLLLSGFAFVGAQKHGTALRAILEGENETTEDKVLAAIGPSGPPGSGPSGPPGSGPSGPPGSGPSGPPGSGPSGPPGSGPSGPPESETSQPPAAELPAPVDEAESVPDSVSSEGEFIPAEDGYFFKQMPDGTYEQTVYVQNEDGTYSPYEE
ncbi:MAG TPA: hypothetical protein QGI72_00360 [Poseidonia sp.]|nr:hypothetical protein [Poseidonia sp.]